MQFSFEQVQLLKTVLGHKWPRKMRNGINTEEKVELAFPIIFFLHEIVLQLGFKVT